VSELPIGVAVVSSVMIAHSCLGRNGVRSGVSWSQFSVLGIAELLESAYCSCGRVDCERDGDIFVLVTTNGRGVELVFSAA
jgi:hypothetical protein